MMGSVLLTEDTLESLLTLFPVKTGQEDIYMQARKRALPEPDHTAALISEVQPPELRNYFLLKPPSLSYFVLTAELIQGTCMQGGLGN